MKLFWMPIVFVLTAGIGTVSYLKKDLLIDRIPRLRAAREAESITSKTGSKIDNKVSVFSSEAYLLMSQGIIGYEAHKEYSRYLYHCQSESILPLSVDEWAANGSPIFH